MRKSTFYALFIITSILLFTVIALGFYIEDNETLSYIVSFINVFINLEFMMLFMLYIGWKWVEKNMNITVYSNLVLGIIFGLLISDLILYFTISPIEFTFKSGYILDYYFYHLFRTFLIGSGLFFIAYRSHLKAPRSYLFHSTLCVIAYIVITHILLIIGLPTRDDVAFVFQALLTLGYFGGGFVVYMTPLLAVAFSPTYHKENQIQEGIYL